MAMPIITAGGMGGGAPLTTPYGSPFIADDWNTKWNDCFLHDGVHPGASGYDLCCYASCCTPCALVDNVVVNLPPGSGCCAGTRCGAVCLFGSVYSITTGILNFLPGVGNISSPILAACCTAPILARWRREFRHMHGIKADERRMYSDFCCSLFCAPCTACQMIRELEIRQARPLAYGPSKATGAMSAPIPQTSMSASGPVYGGVDGGYSSSVTKDTTAVLPPPPPLPSDNGKGSVATTTAAGGY